MTNSVRKGWFGRRFLLAVAALVATIGSALAVTVESVERDGAGFPKTISVSVSSLDCKSGLYLVSGSVDCGDDLASWENRAYLCDIPAGQTAVTATLSSETRRKLVGPGCFRVFRVNDGGRLGGGYAEISCLETDGKQVVDTEFTPTPKTAVTVDMAPSTVTKQNYMFASRMGAKQTVSGKSYFEFCTTVYGNFNISLHDCTIDAGLSFTRVAKKDERYTCVVDAKTPLVTITANGVTDDYTSELQAKGWSMTSPTLDHLVLFGSPYFYRSGGSDVCFRGKFYSCQVTEDGESVRDLVPCIRLSDGVLGVYDLQGKSFYGEINEHSFPGEATAMSQLVDVEFSGYCVGAQRGLIVVVK